MDDEPIQLPIDGVLDLHTFKPREVKELVLSYLAECQQKGIFQVRIIHGKGIGNLRRTCTQSWKSIRRWCRSRWTIRSLAAGARHLCIYGSRRRDHVGVQASACGLLFCHQSTLKRELQQRLKSGNEFFFVAGAREDQPLFSIRE
jgi:hypothetical protein